MRGGYQIRPPYPPAARLARAEGTTMLRVRISMDGRIDEVEIQSSAGHPALDRAAADAVRKWRFEPARNGSAAVAVWVVIPVEFRLKNDF
jgi:protein TonB